MARWMLALPLFWALVGCGAQTGLDIPSHWQSRPALPAEVVHRDTSDKGTMQVIICYGWITSNHVCLRLDRPDGQSLFWDPGGAYGEAGGDVTPRRARPAHSVFLDSQAPTLAQVWRYRREDCNEPTMLVFEWHLPVAILQAKRQMLIDGQPEGRPGGSFRADAPGGMCSLYLSDFLNRFADDTGIRTRRRFWPHNLARHLWTCQPSRVRLYRKDRPVQVYEPPPGIPPQEMQARR